MRGNTAAINVTQFRVDWGAGLPIAVICEKWTVSRDQVIRLRDHWSLPKRTDHKARPRPPRGRDPTPEEIAEACRAIQDGWTVEVEISRRVLKPVWCDGLTPTELAPPDLQG